MRGDQRENILNAAKKVFSTSGYSATMAEIATYANVSQGLAYRYFPGKAAIMNELAELAVHATMETIQSIQKMPDTPLQRLGFLITKIVQNEDGLMEFFQIYQQHAEKPEAIKKMLFEQQKLLMETIQDLIREGQGSGEIAAGEPEKLTFMLIACLDGLSKFALLHPDKYKTLFTDASILMRILKP